MLFDRRDPPGLKEKVRVALWPRRNWQRSVRYVLTRLSRLRTSPHAIAAGAASGVLVSFTPFLGLHFLIAGLLAWTLRGSIIASALGTFFGNPLTFPFIWVGTYQFGGWILGLDRSLDSDGLVGQLTDMSSQLAHSSLESFWSVLLTLWPLILKPMAVGGVSLGLVAGLISYYLIRKFADTRRERRHHLTTI
jgi:uncharacterized protein (DUF2062 family)